MRIIALASGKGGVGKTTVALNLAAALHQQMRRTVVIDCNMTTAHLGLMLGAGAHQADRTLNHALRGEISLRDAMHVHQSGLQYIPAALELGALEGIDPMARSFKDQLHHAFAAHDFVLLDAAPGIGKEALLSLQAADDVIYVAHPSVPSLVDIFKTRHLAPVLGFRNGGVLINRVRGKFELNHEDVCRFTELPVIGAIPEDEVMLRCAHERLIATSAYPRSKASRAIHELAGRMAGYAPIPAPGRRW